MQKLLKEQIIKRLLNAAEPHPIVRSPNLPAITDAVKEKHTKREKAASLPSSSLLGLMPSRTAVDFRSGPRILRLEYRMSPRPVR